MNINVIKQEKGLIEIEMDNLTIAEILRIYLNESGVDFAAWRREHPSKPVVFRIQSDKGVKKVISDAISQIKKDCENISAVLKKK